MFMKTKTIFYILLGCCLLLSCGNGESKPGQSNNDPYGSSVGLVQLWTVDSSGAEMGTATFELYEDSGNYYVKFYGTYYKLFRIREFSTGRTTLMYKFKTTEGYHYYLEDVTNEDTYFFRL